MAQLPTILTSAEVCALLHINRSTLTRWVAAGRITPETKLPGIRGAFIFSAAEVERVRAEVGAA